MSGKPKRSGGQNKVDLDLHLLRGTYRPARHAGRLAEPGQPVWTGTPKQIAALGPAGQALVARLVRDYSFSSVEGEYLLEAAVVMDRLAQIRQTRPGCDVAMTLKLDKSEQLWQKQLSTWLQAMKLQAT